MGARGVIVLMGNGHDEGERGRGFPTYMKFFNRIRAVQDFLLNDFDCRATRIGMGVSNLHNFREPLCARQQTEFLGVARREGRFTVLK
jgi:hypothetical protein